MTIFNHFRDKPARRAEFADVAELLPAVERVDGLKVEYFANSMVEAYETFELLVLAASGMTALLEGLR